MRQQTNVTVSDPIIWARAGQPNPSGSGLHIGVARRVKLALGLSLVQRGSRLVVPPTPTPLWIVKGWQRTPDTHEYTGWFAAAGASWLGLVREPYPGGYQAFIWNPPAADIRNRTSHGPCFIPNGEPGRYQVHYHTTPSSLDHAITSIETVLQQACNRR